VIAVASVLAAVCLAIQLTPRPPNVELTSLLTFTSGFLFGSIFGFLFGCFVMFVNGFLSSWGFAGLNMPFQMAGMGLIGLFGGLYGSHVKSYGAGQLCVEAAIMGAFLTLSYDLLTNLGMMLYYVMNGMVPGLAFAITAAYGVPFLLVHVASNIAVFGILFFPLIKTLNHNLMVRNIG
jgi:hypothetical protein